MNELNFHTENIPARADRRAAGGEKNNPMFSAIYFGIFGGIAINLTGVVLSSLASFGLFENGDLVNRIGAFLMLAALPLAMYGAHAMDKVAEKEKARKRRVFEAEQKLKTYAPEQWKRIA